MIAVVDQMRNAVTLDKFNDASLIRKIALQHHKTQLNSTGNRTKTEKQEKKNQKTHMHQTPTYSYCPAPFIQNSLYEKS